MINNLPKGWCECRYRDIGYLQNGYAFSSQQYTKEGINLVRISDIQNGRVDCTNCVKVKEEVDNIFVVQKDDLLLAMSGATTGKIGIYKDTKPAFLNQRVGNLKVYSTDVVCLQYRNYFFESQKKEIERLAYGGAQPNISKSMIENLSILLPPLAEQERIVEKIEELFSEIDEGIKNLKTAQLQLKQYRQSVLKSAFEGKLYKTTDWKSNILKAFVGFKQGLQVDVESQKDYCDKGYAPFLRIVNYTQPSNSSFKYVPFSRSHYIQRNDIVIVRYGATAGFVGMGLEGVLANNLFKIEFDVNNIIPKFLYYYFKYKYVFFKGITQGGAMPAISFNLVGNVSFSLPSLPEQECIVEEIEKRFEVADEMEKAIQESLEDAQKLKQSILKKAFSGQLVPQNPDDEPASVLLDRIKLKQKIKG